MFNPFGGGTYYLGSSIGSTDTTILLSSFLEPVSQVPYTMALLNTDIVYATIAPGTSSSEFISFSGITQNANGTATLTGVIRGLAKKDPFTSSATFKLPHSGQSVFIISDAPQVFVEYPAKENDETISGDWRITGQWTFDTFPITPSNSDASATVKGVTKLSVAPVSPTDPIAVGTNDGRVPTQTENDALVGTAGTPSTSNPYATKQTTDLLAPLATTTPLVTAAQFTVGALNNALVKTYFNIQLPFILWTGAIVNDATTTFGNWVRSDATDVFIPAMGSMADFQSTGSSTLILDNFFRTSPGTLLKFNDTNKVVADWWAKLPASGTGDITMGIAEAGGFADAYNATTNQRAIFAQKATGELYATISKAAVGVTNTDISSGLTLTNWNNYRIELDLSNNALFYVNGVLKATLSGANLPNGVQSVGLGFGRSNTSLFQVTAPNLSLEMNP